MIFKDFTEHVYKHTQLRSFIQTSVFITYKHVLLAAQPYPTSTQIYAVSIDDKRVLRKLTHDFYSQIV